MNILDLFIAVPMVYLIWKGYRRGIIFEVASLAGIVCGTWAAFRFSKLVAEWIGIKGESSILIAFFITFVAVVLLSFFLGKCVQGLVKLVKVGFLNNLLGAVVGMLKCVCIVGVLLSYLTIIDSREAVLQPHVKQQSLFYKPVMRVGTKLTVSLKAYVAHVRATGVVRPSKTNH
ncbi:MAG: CvpA family protein [Bacteroidales bacterium]|nr:CvpA family protein [Bacteroidales bacterium]